jgi:hypothetical protein
MVGWVAVAALAGSLGGPMPAPSPELAKIDRSIAREPAYKAEPRYCLLAFGPRAEQRVWLVEDGDTLYVDRNMNGDLTDGGESFRPTKRRDFNEYSDRTYSVGDLTPPDGSKPHRAFEVTWYQLKGKPGAYVLSVDVEGVRTQCAGWAEIFADRRDRDPVIHFGGPVRPQPIRRRTLSLTDTKQELSIRFGTPGVGRYSFASVSYEAVPKGAHPVVEIEWPGDGTRVRTTVTLAERC